MLVRGRRRKNPLGQIHSGFNFHCPLKTTNNNQTSKPTSELTRCGKSLWYARGWSGTERSSSTNPASHLLKWEKTPGNTSLTCCAEATEIHRNPSHYPHNHIVQTFILCFWRAIPWSTPNPTSKKTCVAQVNMSQVPSEITEEKNWYIKPSLS